jgi:hypothetical protein
VLFVLIYACLTLERLVRGIERIGVSSGEGQLRTAPSVYSFPPKHHSSLTQRMGVKGLWNILEPVGRRVDIASLRGTTVAVDMSIWLISFLHGMKDSNGGILSQSHLLGTFRRLVKLLYNQIKPVFVFDGGTPILKRKTVLLRQQQRERNEARHAQTIRKLLLQQLTPSVGPSAPIINSRPLSHHGDRESSYENDSSSVLEKTGLESHLPAKTAAAAKKTDTRFSSVTAFGDSDDSDAEGGIFDDSVPLVPNFPEDADLSVVASLPPNLQADFIEEIKRKHRGATRSKLIPIAGDPLAFSRVQMAAFLNVAKFNSEIDRLNAAQVGTANDSGRRIASEADRRYDLFDDGESLEEVRMPPAATAAGASLNCTVDESSSAVKGEKVIIALEGSGPPLSDRQQLQIFVNKGSRAGWKVAGNSRGGLMRGSFGTRGRNLPNRIVLRMEAASRDAQRRIALIEGTSTGQGVLSNQHDRLLNESAKAMTFGDALNESLVAGKELRLDDIASQPAFLLQPKSAHFLRGEAREATDASHLPEHSVVPDYSVGSQDDCDDEGGFVVEESALCDVRTEPTSSLAKSSAILPERPLIVDSSDAVGENWEDVDDSYAPSAYCGCVFLSNDIDGISAHDIEAAVIASSGSPNVYDEGDFGTRPDAYAEASAAPLNIDQPRDAAIVEAFEIAGSMRGSAKHAFAAALKGLGRSIPVRSSADGTVDTGSCIDFSPNLPSGHADPAVKSLPVHELDSDEGWAGIDSEWQHDPGKNLPVVDGPSAAPLMFASSSRHQFYHRALAEHVNSHGHLPPQAELVGRESDGARNTVRAGGTGEVTETMKAEVVALLDLFGVPYVFAPMEAEAQCAHLELAGLCQGVVSDDSDTFLFGSRCVYRNIFTDNK